MGGLVFGSRMVDARMIHNLELGSLIDDMYRTRQDLVAVAECF